MKLKDLFCVTQNKKTNQISLHLKSKILKKNGLTTRQLLDWPIPKTKFYKPNKK